MPFIFVLPATPFTGSGTCARSRMLTLFGFLLMFTLMTILRSFSRAAVAIITTTMTMGFAFLFSLFALWFLATAAATFGLLWFFTLIRWIRITFRWFTRIVSIVRATVSPSPVAWLTADWILATFIVTTTTAVTLIPATIFCVIGFSIFLLVCAAARFTAQRVMATFIMTTTAMGLFPSAIFCVVRLSVFLLGWAAALLFIVTAFVFIMTALLFVMTALSSPPVLMFCLVRLTLFIFRSMRLAVLVAISFAFYLISFLWCFLLNNYLTVFIFILFKFLVFGCICKKLDI